jgi:hypothetical protein
VNARSGTLLTVGLRGQALGCCVVADSGRRLPLSLQRIEGGVETALVFRPRHGGPWASASLDGCSTRRLQRTRGEEWSVGSMPERGSRRAGVVEGWTHLSPQPKVRVCVRALAARVARHWHTRRACHHCSNRTSTMACLSVSWACPRFPRTSKVSCYLFSDITVAA